MSGVVAIAFIPFTGTAWRHHPNASLTAMAPAINCVATIIRAPAARNAVSDPSHHRHARATPPPPFCNLRGLARTAGRAGKPARDKGKFT